MNYFDYFLFIFSVVIMIATPGPVMILVASAGLKGGYKKALETIFGTNLASLVLIFISVLVLKGVLSVNDSYLNIIRILGCLYIGYLGFSILKEVIQAPHPEAIQTVSAQNGGFKKVFFRYFEPKRYYLFLGFLSAICLYYPSVKFKFNPTYSDMDCFRLPHLIFGLYILPSPF